MRPSIALLSLFLLSAAGPASAGQQGTIESIHSRPRKPAGKPARPAPSRRPAPIRPRPRRNAARSTAPAPLSVALTGSPNYRSISAAIAAARPGARIAVRPGVYTESLSIARPVEIIAQPGASGGPVVIRGAAGPTVTMRGGTAVIRGLKLHTREGAPCAVTVTGGHLTLEDCEISGGSRATILVQGAGTIAVIRRCTISGGSGDGIRFEGGAGGRLEESDVATSGRCGVVVGEGCSPVLAGTRFRNCGGDGIRLAADAQAGLESCEASGNSGSGIALQPKARATLAFCRLHDNHAAGLKVEDGGEARADRSSFTHNGALGIDRAPHAAVNLTGCKADTLSGIVSWWPLDGNIQDVVGGNNGVSVTGGTFVTGAIGQGIQFDGNNSLIRIPDAPGLKLAGSLTICAWVAPAGIPGRGEQIFFRGDNRIGLDPYFVFYLPDGRLQFAVTAADGAYAVAETSGPLPLGRFTHIAAVFDADLMRLAVFLDGQMVAQAPSKAKPFGDLDPGQNPGLAIGNTQDPGFSNQGFRGVIDEVQVYNRALSAAEIATLYNRR